MLSGRLTSLALRPKLSHLTLLKEAIWGMNRANSIDQAPSSQKNPGTEARLAMAGLLLVGNCGRGASSEMKSLIHAFACFCPPFLNLVIY